MDIKEKPNHRILTMPIATKTVALVSLGLILILWGIVCAFRPNICGAVLAPIGAASYV